MGDKNPKSKAKDQKRKKDEENEIAKKKQTMVDEKAKINKDKKK